MSWRELLRDEVRALSAYEPEAPGAGLHLEANESPYDLDEEERADVLAAVAGISFNRYPEPGVPGLRAILAARLGVEPSSVMVGNGSDEFLPLLCTVFGRPAAGAARPSILIPTPTFSMYRLCALPLGFDVHEVPRDEGFELGAAALEAAVREKTPNLIFLANPDNPTGAAVSRKAAEAALAPGRSMVVFDQAYGDFAGEGASLFDLVQRDEHAVGLGSLSKVGLAALRLGFLVAQPAVVRELDKVRLPYNIDSVAERIATVLLTRHAARQRERVRRVVAERGRLQAALMAQAGVTVFPSHANFLLLRVPDAPALSAFLRARGLIVRNLSRPGPLLHCLRVTVGTPAENDAFLGALRDGLAAGA